MTSPTLWRGRSALVPATRLIALETLFGLLRHPDTPPCPKTRLSRVPLSLQRQQTGGWVGYCKSPHGSLSGLVPGRGGFSGPNSESWGRVLGGFSRGAVRPWTEQEHARTAAVHACSRLFGGLVRASLRGQTCHRRGCLGGWSDQTKEPRPVGAGLRFRRCVYSVSRWAALAW